VAKDAKLSGERIYISEALIGEPVGLIEDEEGGWSAFYGPIALGVIVHGSDRLKKPRRPAGGLVDNAARCPQGPTRPTPAAAADLNETRNVLPMSPVRSVTHVPGCSAEPAASVSILLFAPKASPEVRS
jgi:putative transposase